METFKASKDCPAGDRKLWEPWAKARGLVPVEGRECYRRLFGKRCLRFSAKGNCDCLTYEVSIQAMDHASLWKKEGEKHPSLLVWQPYGMTPEKEAQLEEYCQKRGLAYKIKPKEESFWYPGSTYLIEITVSE